ncbi:synaptic vesicle 2-related protein-like [Antennarius striatus]|uniref:synaptic vesicle 2-related protein-like n=1 Tax=Antennarius striatus TaxID=241820 RepID=UPI0035AFE1A0
MDYLSRPRRSFYKHHRNNLSEEHFVGQSDEDQNTDNEICTIASRKFGTGGANSAPRYESDETEETLTVEDVLETTGFGKFQWKLCALTGLSWTGDAMEMMILSILSPQLKCEWRLPGYKVALITSVVFIGMLLGCPIWGQVSDKYGRRIGLTMCMCWILFYGLLSAFSPGYGWVLLLRGLVGFGVGGSPQAVTLYSEFLPIKKRGTSIMMMSLFFSVGTMFVVLLALWIMPTLGWRWLVGVSTLPLAIFMCFTFWLPESPRYDLLTGNTEKAMATLQRIARENGKTMPQGKVIAHKQKNRGQIKDLLSPQYRKTTLLLLFIWFANAFSYYGIVLMTPELLQSGGICGLTGGTKSESSCNLQCNYLTSADYKDMSWTTFAEMPGVFGVLLMVERIGRKNSMALCFFFFFFTISLLYACIGRIPLTIFIFIARAFITGGFQAAYVYTPEVFPTETRAFALGTCSAMARCGSLITPFVSEVMLRKSMYLTLSIYCGCSLLAGIMCLILPMETSGKSLQETTLTRRQMTTATSQ